MKIKVQYLKTKSTKVFFGINVNIKTIADKAKPNSENVCVNSMLVIGS